MSRKNTPSEPAGPADPPGPADFGPIQAPRHLGIPVWKFDAAVRRGLIDGSGPVGRWSAAAIADAKARLPEILAAVGDQAPIGAGRAADRIAERLGDRLDAAVGVEADEVDQLADRGLLTAVDEYKGRPLYDAIDLDQAADQHADLIAELAAARHAWQTASLHPYQAQERLRWTRDEFTRVVKERGIEAGRFGRYAAADIEALAADEQLQEQVRGERLLGPDQAAERLEIRRTDFDYSVAAGWISATDHTDVKIGSRRWITVPLYRTADVDALREIPGIDWEPVRAARPGEPSPLREYAVLPTARATLIRGFAADLTDRYSVPVTAVYDDRTDSWELTWPADADGAPDPAAVRQALAADPDLAPHTDHIAVRILTEQEEPQP